MCVETKRIIKSRDVIFIEGSKEIGGVPHLEKEKNVVVHEEVEGEEPLTFSWDTPLNETRMEGVQSESTPSSSLEEEFVVSNDNPFSEPSFEKKTFWTQMLQQTLFSKDWKLWKKSSTPHVNLKGKNFYHLQIFYYTSLRFHLKLIIMRKIIFDTVETSHFQQLKELSSTHLKLSMNRRTFFHTLSPWNLILSKNLKNKFFSLEKFTTFLKKSLPHLPFT